MTLYDVLEPCLVGLAILSYFLYHVYLYLLYKRDPKLTTFGHNHNARRLWCEMVIKERRDILGVQTIRNTLMSTSLLATTSLTLSLVVAAYLINTVTLEGAYGLDLLSSPYLHQIHKLFGVILCFAIAFYCYMQSVRASVHASYMIALPEHLFFSSDYVERVLRRGANFHTCGTRIFYLSFILVIWIFGPIPPFVMTLLLLPNLYVLDMAFDRHHNSIVSSPANTAGEESLQGNVDAII